jgi:alanine-glyoxylate transaminase/serine-glyoxylate transaminase/serine-pyruvate transaminase
VRAWGLEILCLNPAEYSSSLTAILMPEGYDESELRKVVLDNFNLSLGAGLAKLAGKVFRIGHLGDLNDLMLCGTLCGVEMGLELFGVPFQKGGVAAAMDFLVGGDTGRAPSHVQRTAASSPEDGGDEKQRTPTLSLPV